MALPRDRGLDATLAFFRLGYDYVGRRCAALGHDGFVTRLMLRRTVCIMGEDAAHVTRRDSAFADVTLPLSRFPTLPGSGMRIAIREPW